MKNKLLFIGIFLVVLTVNAQQLNIPRPSPTQTIKQEFAIGNIEISYSRPGLKGRTIGTDFVPYGELWRTGANGATLITFSDDVTFGQTKVAKGTYGLLSIPGEKEWIVILTSDRNVNLSAKYNKEHDVARVTVPVAKLNVQVETFAINFTSFNINSCELQFTWDHSLVTIPVSTDVDTKISKEIDTIFKGDNKPYYAAAQYYFDTGKDITDARKWIEKATADEKNANMLHMFYLQAQIYQKLGEKKKAKETAEVLIGKAIKMGNDDYVTKSKNLV